MKKACGSQQGPFVFNYVTRLNLEVCLSQKPFVARFVGCQDLESEFEKKLEKVHLENQSESEHPLIQDNGIVLT